MTNPMDILKAVPEVAKAAYTDLASDTLKEVGKIGVDAVKTFRLALVPLQLTAALQDRVAAYIDSAIRSVPEERRIAPQQSVALTVCDNLKFCDPSEDISQLYVRLLARAMDKERVGEAHPAFVNVISQLAPDEILVIRQLGTVQPTEDDGAFRVYLRDKRDLNKIIPKHGLDEVLKIGAIPPRQKEIIHSIAVDPDELAQPELYPTFLEHLVSLGVISYTNEATNDGSLKGVFHSSPFAQLLCIKLSKFGALFYSACVKNEHQIT